MLEEDSFAASALLDDDLESLKQKPKLMELNQVISPSKKPAIS